MIPQREITGTALRPAWLAKTDLTDDSFQDLWAEFMDQESERGEIVTAHYAVTDQEYEDGGTAHSAAWRDLLGITVDGVAGPAYYSRFQLNSAGFDTLQFDGWMGK